MWVNYRAVKRSLVLLPIFIAILESLSSSFGSSPVRFVEVCGSVALFFQHISLGTRVEMSAEIALGASALVALTWSVIAFYKTIDQLLVSTSTIKHWSTPARTIFFLPILFAVLVSAARTVDPIFHSPNFQELWTTAGVYISTNVLPHIWLHPNPAILGVAFGITSIIWMAAAIYSAIELLLVAPYRADKALMAPRR